MAARYWVGGTGTWDASDTTHWSATTGGSGGASVPGASDDVYFDANSGGGTATKTIAGNSMRSLDMTGYTGSLLWNTYGIIGSTSSGDITIRFSSAITWANDLYIVSASGFTTTVYMAGSRPGASTYLNQNPASTGTILLADAWVQLATADLTIGNATSSTGTVIVTAALTMRNINITSGTVHFDGASDNSGLSHTFTGTFNGSNTNTRSIYLGNCTITLSLAFTTNVFNFTTYTNLTFNAGTSTIIITGTGSGVYGGLKTFNNIQLNGAGFAALFQVVATNITRTGTAAKTDFLDLYSDITCTNLTITGNSILNRILVRGSQTLGTPSTLTVTGSLTLNNVDFRDVMTSGAAWSSPTITGGVGDAGGNSATISGYTPAATQYWKTTTTGSKNWSTAGNWFLATNGGGGAGRVPLPQDDVVFDANSIGAATTTIQIDMPRVGRSLYFTGVTNSPTLSLVVAHTLYGDLTLVSGMSVSGTVTTTFEGRGSYTLTTAGKTFGGIVMNGVGGTLTVSGNLTVSTGGISITAGTLDCSVNNPTVSTPSITATGVITKALKMGSGTWTTTGTGASAWNTPTASSGFTLTAGASTLIFTAASGGPTPTFGGQVLNNVTINTAAGVLVTWQDAMTCTGALTLTQGTLALNGKTTQAATFVSTGSSTRTLTPGSGTPVTLTAASGTVWNVSSSMGITNPIVAWTITLTGSGSVTFAGAGLTYRNLVFNGPTSPTISGTNTFENLTLTGPAVKTCVLTLAANQTVTSTLTFAGNSTVNRVLITSDVFGTQRTITNSVGGSAMVWSNVDFRDISLSSAYNASAITGLSGDCGGNSNITFTTPQTNYWVSGIGIWSDAAKWKLSDHSTAGRVPLPQDNVRFDASSFTNSGQSVQADMPRLGKDIDWTGCTFSPTWTTNVTSNFMYGSLTLVSTGAAMGGGTGFTFEGRGTHTITWAGITTTSPLIFAGSGSYTFQDAATVNASPGITLTGGTLASAYSITARSFLSSNSNTRTLSLTGPMTLTSINTVWDLSTSTGLTITALPPSISITDTSTSNKTFAGGGKTYGNLSITGTGSGTVTISGSNTFGTFTIGAPKTVIFTAGTTQIVSGFVATGSVGNLITLKSSAAGSRATLSKAGGTVGCDYLSIQDINATGTAIWYAGSHSSEAVASSTSGWLYQDEPPASTTFTYAGTGGGLSAGWADVLWARPPTLYSGSGLAQSGGSATLSWTRVYIGSGGAVSGGAAAPSGVKVFKGCGGAVSGGVAAPSRVKAFTGSGGAQVCSGAQVQRVTAGTSTPLTEYLTSTNNAGTLSATARNLTNSAPAAETSLTTKVAKATGWSELYSRGTTANWAAGASEPNPTGNGWLWDVTTLEGKQFNAATWTPTIKLATSVASGITASVYVRAYKRSSAGVYTLIAKASKTAWALTSTASASAFTGVTGTATTFAAGDKLYIDIVANVTANTANSTTATINVYENGGANEAFVTPGYTTPGSTSFTYFGCVPAKTSGAAAVTFSRAYGVAGGAISGGASDSSFVRSAVVYTGSGGAQSGGAAVCTDVLTHIYAASGGAVSSGSSATSYQTGLSVYAFAGSGQASAGGLAGVIRTKAFTGSGGAQSGGIGTTTDVLVHPYSGSDGAHSGGSVATVRTKAYPGSGGGVSGGAVTVSRVVVRVYSASGGAQSGGTPSLNRTRVYVASGGASSSSSAGLCKVKDYQTSGGGQSGGAPILSLTLVHPYTGSGGAASSGSAVCTHLNVYPYTGSGGASSAGAGVTSHNQQRSYSGSGVATGSGSATIARSFVSAGSGGAHSSSAAIASHTQLFSYIGTGGANSTGAANLAHSYVHPYTGSGGAQSGGACSRAVIKAFPSSGGGQSSGSASLNRTRSWSTSGGAIAAGIAAALVLHVFPSVASGGSVASGSAQVSVTKAYTSSGGASASGSSTVGNILTYGYLGSGGGKSGGSCSVASLGSFNYTSSGTGRSAGSAGVSFSRGYAASGGASSFGSAVSSVLHVRSYSGSGGGASSGSAGTSWHIVKTYQASGGALSSGAAFSGYQSGKSLTYSGSGGGHSNGTTAIARTRVYTGSGSATSSGTALASITGHRLYAAIGGALSGGSAVTETVARRQYTSTGGAKSGGSASLIAVKDYRSSGVAAAGGRAAISKSRVFTGSGGSLSGGSAHVVGIYAFRASGGASSSGGSAVLFTKAYRGSGRGISAGTAEISAVLHHLYTGGGGAQSAGSAECQPDFLFKSLPTKPIHGGGRDYYGQAEPGPAADFGKGALDYYPDVSPQPFTTVKPSRTYYE